VSGRDRLDVGGPPEQVRANPTVTFVIHVSVDGLRPDAIAALGPALAPNFHRLRREGVFTDNARSDPTSTCTLPNHTTQITGRFMAGLEGHHWTANVDTVDPTTLHSNRGFYVAGVFDQAHDRGLRTALFAGKSKFSIFDRSWNETYGAPDATGDDDGRDKIDRYLYDADVNALVAAFVADMGTQPFHYALLHLSLPDAAGHGSGWDLSLSPPSAYLEAVIDVDGKLGAVLSLVESDPVLAGHTALIVTADHGGHLGTTQHGATTGCWDTESAVIPFMVWGPGVGAGVELYALNPDTRLDPGVQTPSGPAADQPIRNGDAANLALDLLDLTPIVGSTINAGQDLFVGISSGDTDPQWTGGGGQPDGTDVPPAEPRAYRSCSVAQPTREASWLWLALTFLRRRRASST
jgi:hypothetical protein